MPADTHLLKQLLKETTMSPVQLTRIERLMHRPDTGILLLRAMVGVVGVYHGAQKLFGWFGGDGIRPFAGFLESLGVPLPLVNAYLAGGAEFFGGALLIAGLFTRLAAVPFMVAMLVAAFMVHGKAFDARQGGLEYPLTLAVALAAIAMVGPGRYALDRLVRRGA